MKFEITILGSGSATPTLKRQHSAQFIYFDERYFLIDCGEGTQMQLRRNKVKFQKISHIFISHLHGDHYLGLTGLISSFHLLGRKKELHIFGPKPLKELIRAHLKASKTYLKYPVFIHEIDTETPQQLFEDKVVRVSCFPLKHRVPCMGFRIQEKERELSIKKEAIAKYKLSIEEIKQIKEGKDLIKDGEIIAQNEALTNPQSPLRSYAYCSDTAYFEDIIPHIKNASLLYHESTFLNDLADRASKTFHSTAAQAAAIANKAEVNQLLLGHFSARYNDINPFKTEAKEIFSNVLLAEDNAVLEIN